MKESPFFAELQKALSGQADQEPADPDAKPVQPDEIEIGKITDRNLKMLCLWHQTIRKELAERCLLITEGCELDHELLLKRFEERAADLSVLKEQAMIVGSLFVLGVKEKFPQTCDPRVAFEVRQGWAIVVCQVADFSEITAEGVLAIFEEMFSKA